jgi:hypothetical protein
MVTTIFLFASIDYAQATKIREQLLNLCNLYVKSKKCRQKIFGHMDGSFICPLNGIDK